MPKDAQATCSEGRAGTHGPRFPGCVHFLELHNTAPQTGELKTTEMHFLTILEARSSRPRYGQGHALSKAPGENRLLASL